MLGVPYNMALKNLDGVFVGVLFGFHINGMLWVSLLGDCGVWVRPDV